MIVFLKINIMSTEHSNLTDSNDHGLDHLHSQLHTMVTVVKQQLDNAMEALNEGNIEQALTVIDRNAEVKQFEIKMDNEVLATIAQHNVDKAINLHAIIATSKIVAELEKMGNEIVDFSEFITVLYDPGTSDPNQNLLKDIIKIGELVTANLGKLLLVVANRDSQLAYTLLQSDRDYEQELQEGIKHQLELVVHNIRMIRRALDILQMIKSLERCGEHCRNIAEFMILMIDGVDVRHAVAANSLA